MADSFDFPANSPIADKQGNVSFPWLQVFSRWQRVIQSMTQSGTTANRPTSLVWIGRRYFDTDLGKPIWVLSVGPVVWVDATGTPV